MAFYGERFHRKDEEDIWEQLKQMLLNPASDEEIALNKQQEQAKIDLALEKMFPSVAKPQADPYLNYEDLLPEKEILNGKIKSLTEPAENILTNIAYPLEELKDTFTLDNSDTIAGQIKDKLGNTFSKDNLKKVAGAGLQAASLIPQVRGAGILAKGAGAIGKKLAPKVGRKIAKEIGDGTVAGTVSGALEGLGRGLITDENPLKTTLQDAGIGAMLGTTGGAIGGKIAHNKRVANLNELKDKRKDWGIAFTKQSGKPAEAIDKLLEQKQGFVPKATKKKGIGDIDFVYGKQDYNTGQGYGLEHIIDGRTRKNKIDGIEYVKSLPKTFNNGVVNKDNRYPNHNYIEDFDNKIAIPNNWLGKERNWVLTAHPQNKSASKRLATSAPMSKPNVDSRYNNFTTELTADNNIIQNSNPNLNPSQQDIQKQSSFNDWLEELKRKRKKRSW